jgi:hypothetical protein
LATPNPAALAAAQAAAMSALGGQEPPAPPIVFAVSPTMTVTRILDLNIQQGSKLNHDEAEVSPSMAVTGIKDLNIQQGSKLNHDEAKAATPKKSNNKTSASKKRY